MHTTLHTYSITHNFTRLTLYTKLYTLTTLHKALHTYHFTHHFKHLQHYTQLYTLNTLHTFYALTTLPKGEYPWTLRRGGYWYRKTQVNAGQINIKSQHLLSTNLFYIILFSSPNGCYVFLSLDSYFLRTILIIELGQSTKILGQSYQFPGRYTKIYMTHTTIIPFVADSISNRIIR